MLDGISPSQNWKWSSMVKKLNKSTSWLNSDIDCNIVKCGNNSDKKVNNSIGENKDYTRSRNFEMKKTLILRRSLIISMFVCRNVKHGPSTLTCGNSSWNLTTIATEDCRRCVITRLRPTWRYTGELRSTLGSMTRCWR